MNIDIRNYDSITDEAFLIATWIKSNRSSPATRAVPTPIYLIGQRYRIMKCLKAESTRILVACDSDESNLIYGYAVWGVPSILHYVYVKKAYRGAGVAKALLEQPQGTAVLYTHRSPEIWVERLLRDKYINYVYNPYLLEEQNANN